MRMTENSLTGSNFLSFRTGLEEMIKARTPLIYVGSIEIKRCLKELKIIASRLDAETRIKKAPSLTPKRVASEC